MDTIDAHSISDFYVKRAHLHLMPSDNQEDKELLPGRGDIWHCPALINGKRCKQYFKCEGWYINNSGIEYASWRRLFWRTLLPFMFRSH